MTRLLKQCPSCGSEMIITELSCTQCDTRIQGVYESCSFCELPEDDIRFLEIFVTCRGNIKEMERETGLGYWTIRGQLDDVIVRLREVISAPANAVDIRTRRREILNAVERGELSVNEAEQMLLELVNQKDRR